MKYSIFNSIIPLTQYTSLLYNSFSDAFITFKDEYRTFLKDNHEILKEKAPDLYRSLIENGYYVNEQVDEYEELRRFSDQVINDPTMFFLIINPTLDCNFNCWYCYENHIKGSKMDEKVTQRTFTLMEKIIQDNPELKTFALGFFGGEPLLNFKTHVLPFIEKHAELCRINGIESTISFTTNGALITEKMVGLLRNYGGSRFQITLDGGKSQHDNVRHFKNNKGSYDLILKNIRLLLENKMSIRLRINYTQDNYQTIPDILSDLSSFTDEMKKNLEIDFQRVWQDKDNSLRVMEGIRSVINQFMDEGFFVIHNDFDEIRNCCYADKKNSVVVNFDGNIFKCTAKDFNEENREGYLDNNSNLIWEKSQEYRAKVKLRNKICRKCRIAPLCGGGCSRFILDREKEGLSEVCPLGKSEETINQIILDRLERELKKSS